VRDYLPREGGHVSGNVAMKFEWKKNKFCVSLEGGLIGEPNRARTGR